MSSSVLPVLLPRLPCCAGATSCASKKQSRDFECVSLNEEREAAQRNAENDPIVSQYFKLLFDELLVMGALSWGSMPVCFVIAWTGWIRWSLLFAAAKFIILAAVQWKICHQIDQRPQRLRLDPIEEKVYEMTDWSHCSCCQMLWELALAALRAIGHSLLIVGRFAEAVDPDTDAMTPGNTKALLSDESRRLFAGRWFDVPVVGPVVARLGLPTILGIGLAIVTAWQIYQFLAKAWQCRLYHRDKGMDMNWATLFHLADMTALHILSPRLHQLHQQACSFWVQHPDGVDRHLSYLCRVPEMVFQGWFSVTALALTIDSSALAEVGFLLFSISASCFASVKSFHEMASIYRPLRKLMIGLGTDYAWIPLKCLFFMIVHVLGFMAIGVRLAGVWLCDSHEFSLSSMKCC